MKKKSSSQSAFFNLRVLIGLFVFLAGVFLALLGSGAFSNVFAQTKSANGANADQSSNSIYSDRSESQAQRPKQPQPRSGPPDVVQMVGPVALNQDLRTLPYIPQEKEGAGAAPLTRYPRGNGAPPPLPALPHLG